jgi:hypothetical protein
MINHRRILGLLFVLVLLFAGGESLAKSDSVISVNKVPGRVERKARRLMHDLKKRGFEVSRGYFKLWTIDDCDYTIDLLGSCLANNPAAPYIASVVPPWPEEFVDPADSSVFGPSIEGYNDVYRLDPREAIVILGQLPPPAAYFSEQTYLFSRQGTYNTNSSTYKNIDTYMHFLFPLLFEKLPDDRARFVSISSLSNFINNVVIERQSDAAFDQIRYFIITPDQFMDKAVRKAFAHIGAKDLDIFTEPIPSNMRTGLDEESDDFTTSMRYAETEDGGGSGTASYKWRKNLPLVVLRVRDTRSDRQPQTYPPAVLETRTAVDELSLKHDLGSLLYAVSERWEQPCTNAECSDRAESFGDMQTFPAYLVGPLCTPIGENCLGDNWDTIYQFFGPMSLDSGEIYAVAGTLGTETGNATYVGLGINQVSIIKGVANLRDKELDGTADAYAGEVSNTDKFYLYYFTRNCSGLEDLTDGNCFSLPVTMIPQGDHFALSIRDYIKPDTQRGPDSSLVLRSEAIKLQRP